jgi:hypothetical protein
MPPLVQAEEKILGGNDTTSLAIGLVNSNGEIEIDIFLIIYTTC